MKKINESKKKLEGKQQDKWLIKTGKGHLLPFSEEQLRLLHKTFMSLDDDGSGFICVDELEEPLVGLGFANTRDDVDAMIKKIDGEDGDGYIEFAEFLQVLKADPGDANDDDEEEETAATISDFFKKLAAGEIGGSKELPFLVLVQEKRRRFMMDALISDDEKLKLEGKRILDNVSNSIQAAKQRAKEEEMKEDDELAEGLQDAREGETMQNRHVDEDDSTCGDSVIDELWTRANALS